MKHSAFNPEFYGEYQRYLREKGEDNGLAMTRLQKNLRRAIGEELTGRQKEYLEKYYLQKMTMPQIAREAGVAVSTVSRTLRRGRMRLKKCLKYGAAALLEEGER